MLNYLFVGIQHYGKMKIQEKLNFEKIEKLLYGGLLMIRVSSGGFEGGVVPL